MNAIRKRINVTKLAFSSREGLKTALLVEQSDGFATTGKGFSWSNAHMDPTPPEERTWEWWNFICVLIAHSLGAIAIVVNSRFGATYHIGYPVYQRVSFGLFGSFFPVLLRCGTGIIWVGVQLYQGGLFTSVILRCIFGHKWANIKNTIPLKSDITTVNLGATLIFVAFTLPLLFMQVHKTRWLWTIKSFVLPPAVIGLFIYTQVMSSGGGGDNFTTVKHFKGAELAWTMLKYVNSAMGKTSPSQVNQPDLARYSKTRSAPGLSQLLTRASFPLEHSSQDAPNADSLRTVPIVNTAVACLGIFATSAVYSAWGVLLWNPWSLCQAILDHHWTGEHVVTVRAKGEIFLTSSIQAGVRFAILLVSLSFTLSIFVSNQAVNVIPFGADMTALAPRFLDINRGQVLAYILGLCICPWYILNSATSFLTFLGGYSIFLGPIVGVSGMDYFYRRGNVHVSSLYTASKDGHYFYGSGVHWRAYAAFWLGCIPTIPGFAGTFGHKMPAGFIHLFYIGWLYSIVSSALIYLLLCIAFPPPHMAEARAAPFESWADDQQELLDRTARSGKPAETSLGDEEKAHHADPEVKEVTY